MSNNPSADNYATWVYGIGGLIFDGAGGVVRSYRENQRAAEKRATEAGQAFYRWPDDSPWHEAEQFCDRTLSWIESIRRSLSEPPPCPCGREDDD